MKRILSGWFRRAQGGRYVMNQLNHDDMHRALWTREDPRMNEDKTLVSKNEKKKIKKTCNLLHRMCIP